ncbi:hypothetical protein M0812_06292 [Anaeramoeba flamelloides]|uniref:Uncharacterized protein n=1 Tax=Anaeramoeba flamelloides TaxID=1746091 RepID=A0AAV8A900_9EUKA|nr:hypothetical protein M0812_06292 [Anaeramoeba flamelloides]
MGDSQSWFLSLYRTMKVLTISIAVFLIVANIMILIKLRPDSVDGPGRGMFHMFCRILTLGSGSFGDGTVNIIKDIFGWCAVAVGVLYVNIWADVPP